MLPVQLRKGSLVVGREDKHLQRDVLLETDAEQEIDQQTRRLRLFRALQDTCEFDLPETGAVGHDDPGGRLVHGLFGV